MFIFSLTHFLAKIIFPGGMGVYKIVVEILEGWGYDFSSIFYEFLKFKKYVPLPFTAELQGEWAESVCDVSRGSRFAWRDDERVKRLQIRGHRGIVQRKHLLQCLIGV